MNVIDISFIFYDCSLIQSLPNISRWNTKNITNINSIFYNCCSLSELPYI